MDEVTKIGMEPSHIGRHHSPVSGEVSAPSPRVGSAGYRGGRERDVLVSALQRGVPGEVLS